MRAVASTGGPDHRPVAIPPRPGSVRLPGQRRLVLHRHGASRPLTEGQRADKASDMYAVGCLLYELLTGKRVFASGDVLTETGRHRSELPALVTEIRLDVPLGLEQLVLDLLAKEPSERSSEEAALIW